MKERRGSEPCSTLLVKMRWDKDRKGTENSGLSKYMKGEDTYSLCGNKSSQEMAMY